MGSTGESLGGGSAGTAAYPSPLDMEGYSGGTNLNESLDADGQALLAAEVDEGYGDATVQTPSESPSYEELLRQQAEGLL